MSNSFIPCSWNNFSRIISYIIADLWIQIGMDIERLGSGGSRWIGVCWHRAFGFAKPSLLLLLWMRNVQVSASHWATPILRHERSVILYSMIHNNQLAKTNYELDRVTMCCVFTLKERDKWLHLEKTYDLAINLLLRCWLGFETWSEISK